MSVMAFTRIESQQMSFRTYCNVLHVPRFQTLLVSGCMQSHVRNVYTVINALHIYTMLQSREHMFGKPLKSGMSKASTYVRPNLAHCHSI